MAPFSPAQSKSVPMKTRLKMKLAKIIQSEKNDERRTRKIKPINSCIEDNIPLRRTHSSPSLRSLKETSWNIGRGKGGKKLGVGGGLIKSLPEKGFQEWAKMHKESTKKLIEKRRQSIHDVGASPAFNKIQPKKQSVKTNNRKFGN